MLATALLDRPVPRAAEGPSADDIRRYAHGLLDSYGRHALSYADDMVRAYLANGDMIATDVWREVQAVLTLLCDSPGRD